MKRLSDEENAPAFVILNRSEGSLLSHITETDKVQTPPPDENDTCWRLTSLEVHIARAYKDRD